MVRLMFENTALSNQSNNPSVAAQQSARQSSTTIGLCKTIGASKPADTYYYCVRMENALVKKKHRSKHSALETRSWNDKKKNIVRIASYQIQLTDLTSIFTKLLKPPGSFQKGSFTYFNDLCLVGFYQSAASPTHRG